MHHSKGFYILDLVLLLKQKSYYNHGFNSGLAVENR